MLIEIKFIPLRPYEGGGVVHLGQAYSKTECMKLIKNNSPDELGVYEYVVHDYCINTFASTSDQLAVEKTLDRIFER